jgi:hypothetical protein
MENNQPRKYPAAARDYDQCPKAAESPSLVLAQVSFCLVLFNVSHAARCVACHGVRSHAVPGRARGRMLHPGRVERRAPAAHLVLRQLQVVALAVHPDGDVADAEPGVEPGPERVQCQIV